MAFDNSNVPTAPKGCEFRDDYLSYTQSGFSWATALFLIIFWSIWTFFCGMMFFGGLSDKNAIPILIMIPFMLADVFVLCILMYCLFGKETGWMDETGFHREYRCLFVRLRKDVPLSSIRKFKLGLDYSFKQNNQPSICVQIVTPDKDINVMRSFAETDKQHWLVAAGNAVLMNLNGWESVQESSASADSLSSNGFIAPSVFEDENSKVSVNRFRDKDSDELDDECEQGKTERFSSSDHVPDADKPEGTSWKIEEDFDRIEFKRRGRWTMGLIGSLFVAAFWNGIVSVFLCGLFGVIGANDNAPDSSAPAPVQSTDVSSAPTVEQSDQSGFDSLKDKHMIVNGKPTPYFGRQWWFIFCFLIPFEIIGLGMIWVFLSHLFAPCTSQSWTFSSNYAVRRRTLFGIPFTRRFDMMDFSYLEIQHYQYQSNDKDELTFYDRNNRKILKIKNLNRADARWIANEVLTRL